MNFQNHTEFYALLDNDIPKGSKRGTSKNPQCLLESEKNWPMVKENGVNLRLSSELLDTAGLLLALKGDADEHTETSTQFLPNLSPITACLWGCTIKMTGRGNKPRACICAKLEQLRRREPVQKQGEERLTSLRMSSLPLAFPFPPL